MWSMPIDKKKKDIEKVQYLKDNGYGVLILWEKEVMTNPRSAFKKIKEFLCE